LKTCPERYYPLVSQGESVKSPTPCTRAQADGRPSVHHPAWNGNRTLRANYAFVDSQSGHYPKSVEHLRFLRSAKRLWESVGSEPDRVLTALRNLERDPDEVALGRTIPVPSQVPYPTLGHSKVTIRS
jgi:hypothetical protein